MAVGLMILAAAPGGPTSNLITQICKGNIALSVTLTAIVSFATIITAASKEASVAYLQLVMAH